MKFIVSCLLIGIFSIGCKSKEDDAAKTNASEENKVTTDTTKNNEIKHYKNKTWKVALEFPSTFKAFEGELPGNNPVINFYLEDPNIDLPLKIHEEPGLGYIAMFPKGFGVDAPSGKSKSIKDWAGSLQLSFHFNELESRVYLLENGEPWAYFIKFHQPPEEWSEASGIFVHYPIKGFKSSCISKSGESKPMEDCDTMAQDRVVNSGTVKKESKARLDALLSTLYFFRDEDKERPKISDLIEIEKTLPNMEVSSPLKITGKARGTWFFEADAPIEIVDKDYQSLGKSYIKATDKWMTEDLVPFSGTIEFEAPSDERGYIIFRKANPAGKPEFDRVYTWPVLFPPK